MAKSKRPPRTRNWTGVVYPDSAPENWRQQLDDLHVPYYISPLHDRDVNPDGALKKPHYHIIIMFGSVKTFEQVKEIFDAFNAPHPQYVNSLRGMARYLCHLDNPEKAQYDPSGVVAGCGADDYLQICSLPSDKYQVIGEMMDWVTENNIVSYADLMRYARANNENWFRALCDHCSMVMIEFIKSSAWTVEHVEKLDE